MDTELIKRIRSLFGLSNPIAETNDSYQLYDDGQYRPTKERKKITKLRAAVLSENSYTPEAREALEKIPVNLWEDPKYPNFVGGYLTKENTIGLRKELLDLPNAKEILRHEYTHALDNGNLGKGEYSSGLYDETKDTVDYESMYPGFNKNNAKGKDEEALATLSGRGGARTLLDKWGKRYQDMYKPMTLAPHIMEQMRRYYEQQQYGR